MRILILDNVESLSLKVSGLYEVSDGDGQRVFWRGKNLKTTVTGYKDGILMAGRIFRANKIFLKTQELDIITINGRNFKGDIQFINNNGRLSAINYLNLEDYVKGVLYHEASHYWPPEALKAQAIVCRTYAIYETEESRAKDFDLTSDIYSQVYGGKTSERYRTNRTVDETKDQILDFQGKVFPAYYHATCGGHTEDASMLWNIDLAPLKGVACNFCKDSPHFNWHVVLSLGEIEKKLTDAGNKINNIKNILILDRDKSGRIKDLKIISRAKELKISAKDFRNIIGPNVIRSTNFNLSIIESDAVFEGVGWGHGVGLCQWGAYFLAKGGKKCEEILKYYYPGAEISFIENN